MTKYRCNICKEVIDSVGVIKHTDEKKIFVLCKSCSKMYEPINYSIEVQVVPVSNETFSNILKTKKYFFPMHYRRTGGKFFAFYNTRDSGKIEYFTVYNDTGPVAVSTLTNFASIGYISNVGSLKEARGKGFGKIASLYCVARSKENGNTEHALATEEGQYPNEFYKRIGFETRFTALGYVKEVNS